MDNLEKLATLDTQDTRRRQTNTHNQWQSLPLNNADVCRH